VIDLRIIPTGALLCSLLLLGCPVEEDGPVCEPGETQLCVCGDDETGAQACLQDGSGWSACDCGAGDDDDDATPGDDDDDDATPGDDDDDDDDATPGDDDDDDATPGDDDDDDATPDAVITDTSPAQGATDAYYRADIYVEFSDAVSNAACALEGPGGAIITGTTTLSGNDTALTFDPYGASDTDHLEPSTAYTATLSWGAGSVQQLQFSTSDVGTPLADPGNDVVGNDYVLDLGSMAFIQPPGVGSLLAQYIADVHWVFHVQALNDGAQRAELIATYVQDAGGSYEQDLCCPTATLDDETLWINPYLEAGPSDAILVIEGYDAAFLDTYIAGTFEPDGSGIAGVTLTTEMDTRALDALIDPHAKVGAACALLASLGISCQACSDGSGDYCIPIEAVDGAAAMADVEGTHPETGQTYDHVVEVTPAMAQAWVDDGHCDECDSSCALVPGTRPKLPAGLALVVVLAALRGRRRN